MGSRDEAGSWTFRFRFRFPTAADLPMFGYARVLFSKGARDDQTTCLAANEDTQRRGPATIETGGWPWGPAQGDNTRAIERNLELRIVLPFRRTG